MTDVLVVGGGFAGLTAAAALAKVGIHVTVLEAARGLAPGFRGELLHPAGARLLARLSMEGALEAARAVPVRGFSVCHQRNGDALNRQVLLPYAEWGGEGRGFDHGALVLAMRRELSGSARVRLLSPVRVEGPYLESGRIAGVRAGDGSIHRASLVVIADGRHSRLRKLAGIASRSQLLSYTIVVSLPRDALPDGGYGHVFLGGVGPVLAYPYGPTLARMCVDVPARGALGSDRLCALVRENHAQFLPRRLRECTLAAVSESPFSACANHAIAVRSPIADGAAVVGDAGGCSHPLTATGMTSALYDAVTLADSVARYGTNRDALERYGKRRTRFVRTHATFAQALYQIFRGTDEGARALRDGVFAYWQASARARRASISILAGDDCSRWSLLAEFALVFGTSVTQTARLGTDAEEAMTRLHTVRAMGSIARRVCAGVFGAADERIPVAAEPEQPVTAHPRTTLRMG